jgi:hypothetical protein
MNPILYPVFTHVITNNNSHLNYMHALGCCTLLGPGALAGPKAFEGRKHRQASGPNRSLEDVARVGVLGMYRAYLRGKYLGCTKPRLTHADPLFRQSHAAMHAEQTRVPSFQQDARRLLFTIPKGT